MNSKTPIEMTRWWVDWMHLTLHVAIFFANEEDQRKLLQHCTRLLWWKITVHVWVCVRYIFQCTVYAIRYMLRLTHWNNSNELINTPRGKWLSSAYWLILVHNSHQGLGSACKLVLIEPTKKSFLWFVLIENESCLFSAVEKTSNRN